MEVKISPDWKELLKEEFDKEYFKNLTEFVKKEFSSQSICPPGPYIFKAFDSCPLKEVKVVIIGQDPYHTKGVANGLAFSANEGLRVPPSLQNIYKEIAKEFNKPVSTNPDLTRWAKQGVLLLNATLTVRQGIAGSHQKKGWETFTDAVIKKVSDECDNLVFLLWGAYAQKKNVLIDNTKHLILESPHPSPFSAERGFFGNGHFIKANEYLESHKKSPIDW
jgi:uracil-DNA glycosylase